MFISVFQQFVNRQTQPNENNESKLLFKISFLFSLIFMYKLFYRIIIFENKTLHKSLMYIIIVVLK